MDNNENWEQIMSLLFDAALKFYQNSAQGAYFQEKLVQMRRDCKMMLMDDQQEFVTECFKTLENLFQRKERQVYLQGQKDCVMMLKSLGVLM